MTSHHTVLGAGCLQRTHSTGPDPRSEASSNTLCAKGSYGVGCPVEQRVRLQQSPRWKPSARGSLQAALPPDVRADWKETTLATPGSPDVFVHISACRDAGRRPRASDRLSYTPLLDSTGKLRASSVTIEGVPSRGEDRALRSPLYGLLGGQLGCVLAMVLGVVLVSIGLLGVWELSGNHVPPPLTALTRPGCTIKGNISLTSGAHFYHMAGMEDYDGTIIHRTRGERWFCTEAEALAKGWRKAPR